MDGLLGFDYYLLWGWILYSLWELWLHGYVRLLGVSVLGIVVVLFGG